MALRIGQSGLLRIAGCPIRIWLAAANPTLSAAVREYADATATAEAWASSLAVRIGDELVPSDQLDRDGRRLALRLRRRLHKGVLDDTTAMLAVATIADNLSPRCDLAAELRDAQVFGVHLRREGQKLEAATDDEQRRVDWLALSSAVDEPSVERLVRFRRAEHVNGALASHARDRRSHRYAGYIWDVIERAATRSTPRDWHGQLARLLVADIAVQDCAPAVDETFATVWRENVHAARRAAYTGDWPPQEGTRLSLVPLCWVTAEHVLALTSDPDDPSNVHEVELRRTPLLNAILAAIGPDAIDAGAFERAVVPNVAPQDADLLWSFVEHLVHLGIVQPAVPLRSHVRGWDSCLADTDSSSGLALGFTDVYRRTTGSLQEDGALRIEAAVANAQRVLAAIHADQTATQIATRHDDAFAVPLLDLLREPLLYPNDAGARSGRSSHWPIPQSHDSAYSAIHSAIGEHALEASIDLDSDVLDCCGAPPGDFDWPVDAIIRLANNGAAYVAVLDEMFPAGSMDARFITDMELLGEDVHHAHAYRELLSTIEQASGIAFVEVLVPPLSEGAANAVRRPMYTKTWTGDPDLATYTDTARRDARFIPLQAITIRRSGRRLSAEVDGQPICPMYHATRIPLSPWNVVLETLMAAAPLPLRWSPRRLHRTLDAFPDAEHMPRVTTGGLILSGEQWRVDPASLWSPASSLLSRLCALDRLRVRLGLPRWVFISHESGKPAPCDLESVLAVRTIEQAGRSGRPLVVTEMVPSPTEFWLADADCNALCSSVMLRLPVTETAVEMAMRVAPQFGTR